VDWEKVESIMIVLDYNLQLFSDRMSGRFGPFWVVPFAGIAEGSFVSPSSADDSSSSSSSFPNAEESSTSPPALPVEPEIPLEAQDPYGVTGTWMRVSHLPSFPSIDV
jgi:hypothetical protein